jgi:alanine dehydrogenase
MKELWLRFLSGPDIDALGLSYAEIVAAVQDAVRAHGHGAAVVEPRVHLVPDNHGAGHFNVLRGHLPSSGLSGVSGVSGVKVVGDFVANYAAGLPSELGLLTLYDPETGVPLSIMDATLITACRTGAMTAVGARYLARPDARLLGHVGARGTAFWNIVLLDAMFDLDEIRVTSRRPESREAFAQHLATVTGTPIRVTATAEEAFDGADILVEASRLTRP